MKKIFNSFFDLIIPRLCPSCNIKLEIDEECICNNCLTSIKKIDENRLKDEFTKKFSESKIISELFSLFIFEKDKELQSIIHSIKYEQRFLNAKFLGKILGEEILMKKSNWKIDIVIPVPIHSLKKIERGYNQSFYISKGMKSVLNIPLNSRIIKRNKYTETQTKMNKLERQENVKDAFSISNQKSVLNKNILLVDDVITTGATILECGKQLITSGANKIYAVSIAFAD